MPVDIQSHAVRIRIAIADANLMGCGLVAAGLARYSRFSVVGSATGTREVFKIITNLSPEILLLSCNLEEGHLSGLLALPEIRNLHSNLGVVLLIDRPDRETIVQAFRDGARGIFDRSESHFQRLCKCVVSVHQGQIWANTQQLNYVLSALAQTPKPRVVNSEGANLLTKREEDLLRLVVDGSSNRDIAQQLSLSEHTVKNYMFRIFDKLGVSNRVELVLYALNAHKRHKTISLDESPQRQTVATVSN